LVYNFTFIFSQETGFKNIDLETASTLWTILLAKKCGFLDVWFEFLESAKITIIKKDHWEMFFLFNRATKGNLKNFVDDGAWASIIDEFMEFTQNKK
jgi:hypothetical protein